MQAETGSAIPLLRVDESAQRQQHARLAEVKAQRSAGEVTSALAAVRKAAGGSDNLMPHIIRAASVYCTEQEVCDVLREVMGTHSDRAEF